MKGYKVTSVYIYGAGHNCIDCIKIVGLNRVEAIIDQDSLKWGKNIGGVQIISFANSHKSDFVISINNYVDAVLFLTEKGVDKENISVFRCNEKKIVALVDIWDKYLEFKSYRENAVEQVKIGLIEEAYNAEEFAEKSVISFWGTEDDCKIIDDFFRSKGKNITILFKEEIYEKNSIYLFCDEQYLSLLEKLKCGELQSGDWIVLPLFDVKNSLDWR